MSALPLLAVFVFILCAFIYAWWRSARQGHRHNVPSFTELTVGAVTLFFDTLGIGNYAPTTAIYRFLGTVRDDYIPGTLNIGSSVPVVVEALVYVTVINVDPVTLAILVTVGAAGSYLGASIVSGLPVKKIQVAIGTALLIGGFFMVLTNLHWLPGGGSAIGLTGLTLLIAAFANFAVGALNSIGIGNYAPNLILLSFMGMNPQSAFPIMMGSAACMLPLAGIKFAQTNKYDGTAALGLTLGGLPGVIVAASLVNSLPVETIRWLVVVIVMYAGASLLKSSTRRDES